MRWIIGSDTRSKGPVVRWIRALMPRFGSALRSIGSALRRPGSVGRWAGAAITPAMRWVGFAALACAAACAEAPGADLDEPQDADADGKADAPAQSCASVRCGNRDALNILFPGNPACSGRGCERGLAGDELYIPPRNGRPWGDTYELGTQSPDTLSGYSSGRIALLRRLALVGDGLHAVLLDPSWPDGRRDFAGRGPELGEDIVKTWLLDDPWRTFLLVYSRRSTGWSGYAALQSTEVGARVKVCVVEEPHLLVPRVAHLHAALVDPDAWDNGTCHWGM